MELGLIFIIGIVSSFLGSFISGGFSIVVFMLLSILGYEALAILGLLRLGLLGSNLGGLIEYQKAQKIIWKYVLPMATVGAVGSYLGAQLIVNTDTQTIERLVAVGMIIGALVLVSKPQLGVTSFVPSRQRLVFGYISYFFVVIWSTSVTIGVGLFNTLVQTLGFGMSMLEMKGTIKIPALVIGIIALVVFAEAGLIDWTAGLVLFAGTAIGAALGAKGSLKLGDVWLKRIFAISVIGFAIKLMLGM